MDSIKAMVAQTVCVWIIGLMCVHKCRMTGVVVGGLALCMQVVDECGSPEWKLHIILLCFQQSSSRCDIDWCSVVEAWEKK